jgi:hypothetical protein
MMAAIPTTYRGVNFRSRLEARWAVFFDALGWDWQYEPVDLNGWIPDFFIPTKSGINLAIEVKPIFFHDDRIGGPENWYCPWLYEDESLKKVFENSPCDLWGNECDDTCNDVLDCSHKPTHETIIVGANLLDTYFQGLMIGVFANSWSGAEPALFTYGDGLQWDLAAVDGSFNHRIGSGRKVSIDRNGTDQLMSMWAEAGNVVKWFPKAPSRSKAMQRGARPC